MKYKNKAIDLSEELIIKPFRQGIKLIKPELINNTNIQSSHFLKKTFNIYFIDTQSKSQMMNEHTLQVCGFNSNKDLQGKSVSDVWGRTESIQRILANDQEVFLSQERRIVEEDVICRNKMDHTSLSIKLPWYSTENKIIGLLGCTLVIGMKGFMSLPDFISTLVTYQLFNYSSYEKQTLPGIKIDGIYFSKREREIMYYLVRAKSAKEIAKIFCLSYRTVQRHMENIKIKMNVQSKSELIERIFDYFS